MPATASAFAALPADKKHALVSLDILRLVQAGRTPAEALNEVLGAGTFEKLAGDLYDALRAKAAK